MIAFVGAGAVDLGLLPTRATTLLGQAARIVVEPALLAELVARELVHDAAVIEVAEVGQGSFGAPASELSVRLVRGEVMRRAAGEVRAARRAGHEVEVLPAISDEGAAAAFGGVELGPSARGGQRLVHPGTARQAIVEAGAGEGDVQDAVWLAGTPDPELRWFDTRPLFGKRVLVTRARQQAADFCTLLESRGAEPVVAPAIEIHPPDDPAPLAASVRDLAAGGYDVVAFTSANGVDAFGAELARQGRDARVFGGARIAVIGPGTGKALGRLGLRADIVAPEHVGESLADAIIADRADAASKTSRRVLLPRARVARDVAPERLRAAGFTVDVVPAYETRSPAAADLADVAAALSLAEGDRRRIDAVTFTSTSTVTHLLAALGADAASRLERTVVASIGPITTAACQAAGVRVDVTAGVYTILGLTGSLERHFLAVDKREARRRS